jgi:hypothetical protein
VALPPLPVQVSLKIVVDSSPPVDTEPLVALLPDQPSEAVQAVASIVDQVSLALAPLATVLGLAANVMTGAGVVTETVADCEALPPLPLQVRTKVAFAVSAPVAAVPLVPSAPDQAPEAVQAAALVDDQCSVEPLPLATVLGLAVNVSVGAGAVTVTVAD